MENRFLSALRGFYILCRQQTSVLPEMELVYRELFLRDLRNLAIEDEFYPVGSAANHSLLYLISRCVIEFPVSRILEFGAGQTSVLLDRLSAKLPQRHCEITTVEQDPFWANRISKGVRHQVIHACLAEKVFAEETISFYESEEVNSKKGIELAIVDGPTASTRATKWNRIGAADYLKDRLAEDFIVIFDDTERRGESAGADLFARYLAARSTPYYTSTIRAEKQQRLFCSEKFRAAAYF